MSDELSGRSHGEYGEHGEHGEPRHIRVRVEMVLEVTEPDELIRAAWARIEGDPGMPREERDQAAQSVARDEAEAVAYLIDPVDLVGEVPGVVLAQASWSSEAADPDLLDPWEDEDAFGDDPPHAEAGDGEPFDASAFDEDDDFGPGGWDGPGRR